MSGGPWLHVVCVCMKYVAVCAVGLAVGAMVSAHRNYERGLSENPGKMLADELKVLYQQELNNDSVRIND